MKAFGYFYHGLDVVSDIPLPEWEPFENVPAENPDVRISLHEPASDPDAPCSDGEYRFFVRDVGSFEIIGERAIVITPLPGAAARTIRAYVMGSAWAALLYRRGVVVLHASAVLTGGGAALFCGRRGAGKSTLAACLSSFGFHLISDDMCCLQVRESRPPLVYPSAPRLKLWKDAAHHLGWEHLPCETGLRVPKFHYRRAAGMPDHPVPVGALYIPAWGESGLNRLRGVGALHRLWEAGTWRGDLLAGAGNPAQHLLKCANILAHTPVWEFKRPRQLELIDNGVRMLIEQLNSNSPG